MAYTTAADVQADFKGTTFGSGTLVTSAAVTQFIVEADALINSYVGQRWTVPITADTTSLALMSLFSRTLVATRVRGILENKQTTNVDANQQVKADGYSVKDVMKALNDIKNGDMQLSGASLLLASSAFYSNNQAHSTPHTFHKGRKQW